MMRRIRTLLVALALVAAAGAGAVAAYFQFRPDPTPSGATTEQLLLAALGRTVMSPVEISDRLEVADSLCRLDEAVLVEVWAQVEPTSFRFQDFVVGERCPERAVLYAQQTGRYVTQEAIKSRTTPVPNGPSTSQPGLATSTSGPPGSSTPGSAEEPFSPEALRIPTTTSSSTDAG
jgi:hypothetical protein